MNKVLVIVFCFLVFALGIFTGKKMSITKSDSFSEHKHDEDIYTCPMHPEIRKKKPGKCPICHMDLVKASKSKSSSELTINSSEIKLVGVKKYKVKNQSKEIRYFSKGRFISSDNIAFQIFENDLSKIKIGSLFSGHSSVYQNENYEGVITSVDNYTDPNTKTIRVIGRLKNIDTKIPLESSFSAIINGKKLKGIFIPQDAILHTGHKDIVYVFTDEKHLLPRSVILGEKVEGEFLVIQGLNEDEEIGLGANFLFDSEMKIRGIK